MNNSSNRKLPLANKVVLFALACLFLLAGCVRPASVPPVINREAQAMKLSDGSYEVQLSYSVTTSGGPCFNFHSFFTTTNYSTNYLYVGRISGTVDASNVLITTLEGYKDLATKGMTGAIFFTNGTMTVNLEGPNYPDGVHMQGYVPYFLNGTYQLE